MNDTRSVTLCALASLLALAMPTDAHAICRSFTLSNQAEDVILGEAAVAGIGGAVLGLGHAGVCVIKDGVRTYYDVPECDMDTVQNDQILFRMRGGNDRLATMPPVFSGMDCGGHLIRDLDPYDFRFGIAAYMGDGEDMFAGTEWNDWVTSNDWISGEAPADGDPDLLCGWGGDDHLLGDEDSNAFTGVEETLHGGAGSDYCDGDWGINGNNGADAHYECNLPADFDARHDIDAYDRCWEQGGASDWGYF